MTDEELAYALVAAGVGLTYGNRRNTGWFWINDSRLDTEMFVRDWRVAGAMLEMKYKNHELLFVPERLEGESLPRAINEACVKAMKDRE